MPRFWNSQPSDFAVLITTKKCHTMLNNGMNISQTIPGFMARHSGEQRFKAFWSVSR